MAFEIGDRVLVGPGKAAGMVISDTGHDVVVEIDDIPGGTTLKYVRYKIRLDSGQIILADDDHIEYEDDEMGRYLEEIRRGEVAKSGDGDEDGDEEIAGDDTKTR